MRVKATEAAIRIMLTDWGQPFEADAAYLVRDVPGEVRAKGGMGVLHPRDDGYGDTYSGVGARWAATGAHAGQAHRALTCLPRMTAAGPAGVRKQRSRPCHVFIDG